MWGGTPSRNMVSRETGITDRFDPGKYKSNSDLIDRATPRT